MIKRILTFIILIVGVAFLAGCDNDDDPPPPATLTGISISPAQVPNGLPIGVTQQFTATGTYSDNSKQDLTTSVIWSSSAPATASIDGNGLATGQTMGTTDITASSSGLTSDAAALEVVNPTLQTITVAPVTVTSPLAVGRSMAFTAEGVFDNNQSYDVTNYVTWASSDPVVASIEPTGVVTAHNDVPSDTTNISASAAAVISNVVALTTKNQVQDSLIIEPHNLDPLPVNRSKQLVALLKFADGTYQNVTQTAVWTSSDIAIADVDLFTGGGNVTGLSKGIATITARDDITGLENSIDLEVNNATLRSLTVTPNAPAGLPVGNTQAFTAIGHFTDFVDRILKGHGSWSVSNNAASIRTLSDSESIARVTGVTEGSLQVIYTDYEDGGTPTGIENNALLTITPAVLQSIGLWPNAAQSVPAETGVQFTANALYSDGENRDITNEVIWTSSDQAVGVFDTATRGLLLTLPGTAGMSTIVTATMENSESTPILSPPTTVTVNNEVLVSLQIIPGFATVVVGETIPLTANGVFDNGFQYDYTERVSWSSDREDTAVVSNLAGSKGQVTGVGVGSTSIRAELPNTAINTATSVSVSQP